jgi:hypothetical protein
VGPCEKCSRLLGLLTEAAVVLSQASDQLAKTELSYDLNAFNLALNSRAEAQKRCGDARRALDNHRLEHGR